MQQLHLFHKRGRPKTIRPPEPSETQIHIAVIEHLRLRARKDAIWWHTPSEGKRTKSEASRLKAMGFVAGIPDIVLIAAGRVYGLELKSSKGRVSTEQKAMLEAFEKVGAISAVAYGLDGALKTLISWGIIPPGSNRLAA